jgi:hypothetical protein
LSNSKEDRNGPRRFVASRKVSMDLNLIKMCNNCEVGDWREQWKVSMQETSVPNLHAGTYTIKTEMQSLSACAVSISGNLKLNAGISFFTSTPSSNLDHRNIVMTFENSSIIRSEVPLNRNHEMT